MTNQIATVFDLAILVRDAALGCAVLSAAAVLIGRHRAARVAIPVRAGTRRPRA
ncbi:hypothetical protein [Methylobacterium sp. sgz302541]|uniref:hypothetical protein n=1 Tax=unclassified Methylobacterium TaxID=2615210 RepID=UPI003D34E256